MRRLVAMAVVVGVVATACALVRDSGRTYGARFTRAVQVFPGGKVRVLGVDVGEVVTVGTVEGGVDVTFRVDDPDIQLPRDVNAAIVPASLLGERYIQLFPAYQGGPALPEGATIPIGRTTVPAEPDELLRSLQDYLGAIDPDTVSAFVTNAAEVLDGSGEELNSLIEHGANVIDTLSAKRDDLATIIVEFERLARALSTRQEALGRVIRSYNVVAGTLNENRAAVEGTITGLNDMSLELASLLLAHRKPLHREIGVLTQTGRTLSRNAEALAETGHWATRLFRAASRAVDYDRDWLRLNNQGQELGGMILMRLEDRLMELCEDLGLPSCSRPAYWEQRVPSLFCFDARCQTSRKSPERQLTEAIEEAPTLMETLLEQVRQITCRDSNDPRECVRRKKALLECADAADPEACLKRKAVLLECLESPDVKACLERERRGDVEDVVQGLLDETVGNPEGLGGLL